MRYNRTVEFEGKTIDQAIEKALETLGKNRDEVKIQVLSDPAKSKARFFGFSLKSAKILVSYFDPEYPEAPPEEQPETQGRENRESGELRERREPREEISPIAQKGKDFVNQILNDLELDAEVMKVKERGDVVLYILKAKAPRLVIGKNGVLLESLQALAYMVANKDEDKWKKILIDVDHYRERREKKIRYEVNRVAYKVKNSGKPYLTAAYPPYDRRIIHMVVQEIRGVYSESEGTGLYKKIWIRPE